MIISTGEEAQLGLDALSSRHRTLRGDAAHRAAPAPGYDRIKNLDYKLLRKTIFFLLLILVSF